MRRARFIAAAREEAEEAARWYEERQENLGSDFVHEIERAVEDIRRAPEAWSICPDDGRARRFVASRFPFTVVYLVRPDEIVVIAVAHGKRRPGYWRARAESDK